MFSINKYCRNFKPGIPLSKDFRNEAIQMAATRLISEIRKKVSYVPFVLTARTSNVWLPSLSCLRPVRTCFTVTCPCLDENDGRLKAQRNQVSAHVKPRNLHLVQEVCMISFCQKNTNMIQGYSHYV